MHVIKGKRSIGVMKGRITRTPSLYGNGQMVTLDLAGQRFGGSGACTFFGNPVIMAKVFRRIADKLDGGK